MICTSSVSTPAGFCELQKLGDKVPFIEIDSRESLKGLLPRLGTLSSSGLFFFVGLLPPTPTRPAMPPASRPTRPCVLGPSTW